MIVALPCIAFSVKERKLIKKYRFLTFPEFLDNFFIKHKTRPDFWKFVEYLEKYDGKIEFGVLPDYQYHRMEWLMKKFKVKNWIFPLHKKEEINIARRLKKFGNVWLGFPHRKKWRDYDLNWFFKQDGFKKWYLGFWGESKPSYLLLFDGLDTTLPETYSGKYGKIWISWNKAIKPRNMKTIEIFEKNLINFKKAIENLRKQTFLQQFIRVCSFNDQHTHTICVLDIN